MPTAERCMEMQNKLCLDELCRAILFSGGFLGNKDDTHNAKLIISLSVIFLDKDKQGKRLWNKFIKRVNRRSVLCVVWQ